MSEDWDYNTWTIADLQSLLEEIKGILEEREEETGEDFCQACEDGTCSELTTEEEA